MLLTPLRRIRTECDMSLDELAEKTGIKSRVLSAYERNERDIGRAAAEKVLKISTVLGCSVADLLEPEKKEVLRRPYIHAYRKNIVAEILIGGEDVNLQQIQIGEEAEVYFHDGTVLELTLEEIKLANPALYCFRSREGESVVLKIIKSPKNRIYFTFRNDLNEKFEITRV